MSAGAPLGEVAKSLSPRFNLVGLVPSALFGVGVGFLVASGAFIGSPDAGRVYDWVSTLGVISASLLFLAVLVTGLVLAPFQFGLVRVLEGYWQDIPLLQTVGFIGIEMQRRRKAWLERTGIDASALYPKEDRLLPTRLGNVLRAAEDSAGPRHGFDTVSILPRMYPYLSAPLAEAFRDWRNQLDLACRLCAVFWSLTVIAVVALATDGWWILLPVVTAGLGVISYRGAVRAAAGYGACMHYLFDLHSADLVRALGYEPPADPGRAVKLHRQITHWLVEADPQPRKHRRGSTS